MAWNLRREVKTGFAEVPDPGLLRRIAARVRAGWCRAELAMDATGCPVDPKDPAACRWCLDGAFLAEGVPMIWPSPVRNFVYAYLRETRKTVSDCSLSYWNDSPTTTADDIVGLLDECAKVAEEWGR